MKAQELIKNNYKNIPTGKVNHNPLKGIIRCRCGRAMTVKDKKPAAGISKLTYRCSCVDRKSHPDFCKYNIDEVSYDLTNEILYTLSNLCTQQNISTSLGTKQTIELQSYKRK